MSKTKTDINKISQQIKEATTLGNNLKKIIPKNTNAETIIIALAYLAADIAKESPDFDLKKKEILEYIDASFELWGNC